MFKYELSYYLDKYKQPVLWITGSLIFILLAAWITYTIYIVQSQAGKIAVPLQVVPSDASITINDQEVSAGTVYLKAGHHQVVVTKDGFSKITKDYLVEDYNQPAIYISLPGESKEAKQWQASHLGEYRKLELLTREQSRQFARAWQERNPIVKDLPIKDPYFTISYRNVEDRTIKLVISGTSPRFRAFAINHLRQQGYEPTDYNIEFKGFQNPLVETEIKS